MKKAQIIDLLLQGKNPADILPLLNEKDKAIYELLKQGKSYKEIEGTLNVFPAQIAFIKKYLVNKQPDNITTAKLESATIKQDTTDTIKPESATIKLDTTDIIKPESTTTKQDTTDTAKQESATIKQDTTDTAKQDSNTIDEPKEEKEERLFMRRERRGKRDRNPVTTPILKQDTILPNEKSDNIENDYSNWDVEKIMSELEKYKSRTGLKKRRLYLNEDVPETLLQSAKEKGIHYTIR